MEPSDKQKHTKKGSLGEKSKEVSETKETPETGNTKSQKEVTWESKSGGN